MGDEYHRPTYTSPDRRAAYNATQVRLYGVKGATFLADQKRAEKTDINDEGILTAKLGDLVLAAIDIENKPGIKEQFERQSNLKIPYTNSAFVFISSVMKNVMIMLGAVDLVAEGKSPNRFSSGVIFGYSYEGHCYDLPKPKIMIIPTLPMEIPSDDCGYDLKSSKGYRVWVVDKLDQCVELDMNQGFVEQLVLEANLPGKRSPTAYSATAMVAHRNGRLSG